MISIARSWIRSCQAVFKRIARREPAVVTFETGRDGLRIRLHRTAIRADLFETGALLAAQRRRHVRAVTIKANTDLGHGGHSALV